MYSTRVQHIWKKALVPLRTSSSSVGSLREPEVSFFQRSNVSSHAVKPSKRVLQATRASATQNRLLNSRMLNASLVVPAAPSNVSKLFGDKNTRKGDVESSFIAIKKAENGSDPEVVLPPDEQDEIRKIVLEGASVFVGGKAGTGKSYFLRRIIKNLSSLGLRVGVAGSTGIAALNIGGNTFHSLFGVSVDSLESQKSSSSSSSSSKFKAGMKLDSLSHYDVIVIDEVSFLHAGYLELLERTARKVPGKDRKKPFGGIQIILSGDFLQLTSGEPKENEQITCPGVGKSISAGLKTDQKTNRTTLTVRKNMEYYVDKPMFESYAFQNYLLHVQFVNTRRHKDAVFADALNKLRVGELPKIIAQSAIMNESNDNAIRLFGTRNAVRQFNESKMLGLKGEEHFFPSDIAVDGMSSTLTQSGTACLSDVLMIFVVPDSKKQGVGSNRISSYEAKAIIQKMAAAKNIPMQSILWCVLPDGGHAQISRIAIRFSDLNESKCRSKLASATQWVMREAKNDQSNIFSPTPERRKSEGKKVASRASSRRSWSVLRFAVRTIQQFTTIMKHLLDQRYMYSIRNDYALCNKRLKKNCRVMLLKNINETYVNGSLGTVVGFLPVEECTNYLPKNMKGKPKYYHGSRRQLSPVVEGDDGEEGSTISSGKHNSTKITKSSKQMTSLTFTSDKEGLVPLVRMDVDKKVIAVPYMTMPLQAGEVDGFYSVGVICMPLTPAYAFTVHKVQGLTFDYPVLFDAAGLFPCHHIVYVAASRVTRFEYLRVINLSPKMISVHRPALEFSFSLPYSESAVNEWRQFLGGSSSSKKGSSAQQLYLPLWTKNVISEYSNP